MMSKLSAFLHPQSIREEREILISRRFVDETGEPVPFRIRSLTQEENDDILRRSRKTKRVNGQPQEYLDTSEFSNRTIVAATVEPDFSNAELCDAYGTRDPLQVPGKMLLAGEYAALLNAITELSGFSDPVEDVKN